MVWKEKRKIMQRYDVTAPSYDEQYAEEQQRKYLKALENVDVAGRIVLDVGCGSGLFIQQVTDKASMVVGVDISLKLLHKAKSQAKPFQNAFILQADADHLPFSDGFFERIYAFTMLQNMPKPSRTLQELKKVAKKEGRVVVTGLKKAIPLEKFMDLLETSGLEVKDFIDDEAVNCYVAVLTIH